MSKLQVALIGCGGRGLGHVRVLQDFDDVEMVAVCDPIEAARNAAGDEFSIAGRYASVDEMLDAQSLDAVFVATPAHLNGQASVALSRTRCQTP